MLLRSSVANTVQATPLYLISRVPLVEGLVWTFDHGHWCQP